MEEKKYKIYIHRFPNGKVYVGLTMQPNEIRWSSPLSAYKNNVYMINAINKYGWKNVKHEFLFENLTMEEAKRKEIETIAKYRSNNRKYGYNISSGGESRKGCTLSEETKKKISKHNGRYMLGKHLSEETKRKLSIGRMGEKNPMYGKHFSEESKLKSSESHKGKCTGMYLGSKSPRAKMIDMLDENGEYIKTFGSTTEAARELKIHYTSIVKCCTKERKNAGGYKWRYSNVQNHK